MRLREIEADIDAAVKADDRLRTEGAERLKNAQTTLCELIEQMLADDRRHREAHRMSELPFDGQALDKEK